MSDETIVLHILPDGRLVLSAPELTADEAKDVRLAIATWRRDETEVLVINRRVDVVVHR